MNLNFVKYKYRFFIGYIIIGIFSLVVEFIIYNALFSFQKNQILNSFFSVIIGVLFSFWFNIRYNFKISKTKRNRALFYFILISFFSYALQIFLINKIQDYFSYEASRIMISGSLFWIAYLLHLRFSFKDYKKVGVAIYANGIEDINQIFNKVGNYPDFIHVDIVDESINETAKKVLTYKTEVINGFWNSKYIEAHIMSKTPKKWILEILNNVNRIYIHIDIDEEIEELLKLIKENGCEAGIVIQYKSDLKVFEKYQNFIDSILVLAIKIPGYSGQDFEMKSLELISLINSHNLREQISLNIDGGVNEKNISLLKSESVVSGSYVLNAKDPIKNIMILQTSSQYESV